MENLIGMSFSDASKYASDHGYQIRVVKVNDTGLCITDDFRSSRVNVEVKTNSIIGNIQAAINNLNSTYVEKINGFY